MESVFVLQHSYEVGDFDETKFIGVYSTREKAEEAVTFLKDKSGFADYPVSDFYIDEYEIDKTHWEDGFVKD